MIDMIGFDFPDKNTTISLVRDLCFIFGVNDFLIHLKKKPPHIPIIIRRGAV